MKIKTKTKSRAKAGARTGAKAKANLNSIGNSLKRAESARSKMKHSVAHRESTVRMRRARGHLDKVIQMVEEGRPCTDILQQLSAVISALGGCRTLLFSGHLKTCLRPALKSGNEDLIDEIEKLSSRVMKVN